MSLAIVEKASLTDVGRQRQGNEDSYLEQSPLFAVADGMGGARAGEVASKIAVEMMAGSAPADGRGARLAGEWSRLRLVGAAKRNDPHGRVGPHGGEHENDLAIISNANI